MSEGIPEGWELRSLSSLAMYHNGRAFKPADWGTEGLPIIRIAQISNPNVETDFYSGDDVEERHLISNGDLLFSWSATLTALIWKHGPAALNQHIFKVEEHHDVDRKYLHQLILNSIDSLAELSHGSTMKHIKKGVLEEFFVQVPYKPEQQKIASILTSVDDVIEKTEAQISKLLDLKKGMMQDLLTKGIGHTEFKDSPVGRIPKAWKVLPLRDIARVERGKFSHRPRNDPRFYGGSIPFIQTGDVPKESPYIAKHSQSLNEDGLAVSRLFAKGTLVITIAATIGEIGMLTFDSCFPDSLVGIRVSPAVAAPGFILYMMRTRKDELVAFAPQTAQKNINLETLNPFLLPVPPRDEQDTIAKSLFAVDDTIARLQGKLGKARDGKKALMQDLLTGKVRVKVS